MARPHRGLCGLWQAGGLRGWPWLGLGGRVLAQLHGLGPSRQVERCGAAAAGLLSPGSGVGPFPEAASGTVRISQLHVDLQPGLPSVGGR